MPALHASLAGTAAEAVRARPTPLAPVLLVALAATLPLSLGLAGRVHAQSAAQAVRYDIPASSLADALNRFAQQSGVAIVMDADRLRGLRSPGLKGSYGVEEGFGMLLRGSGFAVGKTAAGYVLKAAPVALEPASGSGSASGQQGDVVLPTVRVWDTAIGETAGGPVDGYVARRSATGTKTDSPIVEVPQAINVVGRTEMQERVVDSVDDTLSYTPGVLTGTYGNELRHDWLYVRGFDAPMLVDGLAVPYGSGFGEPRIDPYGLERVEVLKGPSSGLYGQTAPGGIVNLVSKRPTGKPFHEIDLRGGGHGEIQAAFDLGGPLDEAQRFLYRLTARGVYGDTALDAEKQRHAYIAPALTWKPGADTSLTLLASYQKDNSGFGSNMFLPIVGTLRPGPNGQYIARNRFLGEPGYNGFVREQYSLGYDLHHRFDEVWEFRQNVKFQSSDMDLKLVRNWYGLEADERTLGRAAVNIVEKSQAFTVDNQAQADFWTGALAHKLIFGLDYQRNTGAYGRGIADAPSIDVYEPVHSGLIEMPQRSYTLDSDLDQFGLYVQDQMKLGRWVLTLGGRHDWASSSSTDNYGTDEQRDDRAFTGRAGLTYLFDSGIAPYVGYATGFQPVSGTDFDGNLFEPTTSRQWEAGLKYRPAGWNALFTASVFELTQRNVLTTDTAQGHDYYQVQAGEIRVRGVELEAKGSLADNWNVVAAYTYTHAKLTRDNDYAGNDYGLVPRHQAAFWLNHTARSGALDGLSTGAGVRWIGQRFGDNANTIEVPSFAIVDLRFSWDLGKLSPDWRGTTFSLKATNLFDKRYIASCTTVDDCAYGAGRAVYASLNHRW